MKKSVLLLFAALLPLLSCDTNDDGFYNRVYLKSESPLVFIEPTTTFSPGQAIVINANIPRIINVEGQSENVNLQRTSGATAFDFTFVLEKREGTEWIPVDVSDDVIFTAPSLAVGGFFVKASAIYSSSADAYIFNGGITLNEIGDYRLSFTYNNTLTNVVELFSDSPGNNIRINLQSPTSQLNAEGFYNFSVL